MKVKYFIFSIVLIVFILSCKQPAMYNSSGCVIDNNIFNELKKQKAKIKKIKICDYLSSNNKQPFCIVFHIRVEEGKELTSRFFEADIPMLKTSQRIYINAFYRGGKLRNGFDIKTTEKYIETAISDFKKEYEKDLDEETLEKIERIFRYGIGSVPRKGVFIRWHLN